jgi:hypothetical protein
VQPQAAYDFLRADECSSDVGAAFGVVETAAALRAVRTSLDAEPAAAAALQPLSRARELSLRMLQAASFAPAIDHWFDTPFALAATRADALSQLPLLGTWGTWVRGECAADGDWRVYTSSLREAGPAQAACAAPINAPWLLGAPRALEGCAQSGGTVGSVRVKDPSCDSCPEQERYCMEGAEATDAPTVEGGMELNVAAGGSGDAVSLRAQRLRADLRLGWPFEGYEECVGTSCTTDQQKKLQEWADSSLAQTLDNLADSTVDGVHFAFSFEPLYTSGVSYVQASDLSLACLPLPIGAAYLLFYTGSLFLASAGALQLAVAWPTALFLYRAIFRCTHVEALTLMAAPMTVAFSLEALALFFDSWHASAAQPAGVLQDLACRLAWVLQDAGWPCFVQFAIGIVAFAASGLSEWLSIAHFGVFCAIQLTVQLILALVLLPTCLIVYHNWLEPKRNLCCICCISTNPNAAATASEDDAPALLTATRELFKPVEQTTTSLHHATRLVEATLPQARKRRSAARHGSPTWPVPRLLGRYMLPTLRSPVGRRAILAAFGALMIGVAVGATSARPAKCPATYLDPWHPLLRTRSTIEGHFPVSAREETVRASLLWGVAGVSRGGGVDLLRNSSYLGELQKGSPLPFDEAEQAHLASVCDELRAQPWVRRDAERALEQASGSVSCFIDDFRDWVTNTSGQEIHPYGPVFPVPPQRVPLDALREFLFARRRPTPTEPEETQTKPAFAALWQQDVGLVDGELEFVAVRFDTTLRSSACREEADSYLALVDAFVDDANARAPPRLTEATASADGVWASLRSQALLPGEAVRGSMRAAALALAALFLLTGNVVTTLLASASLFCATLTLLSLLVACGWELGVTEAVLACATPALLAPPLALVVRAYLGSAMPLRAERAERALLRGGAPIISSSIAMVVGFAPLLACQQVHAFHAAVALVFASLTIAVWGGIFLPALLAEVGPQPHPVTGHLLGDVYGDFFVQLGRKYGLAPARPTTPRGPLRSPPLSQRSPSSTSRSSTRGGSFRGGRRDARGVDKRRYAREFKTTGAERLEQALFDKHNETLELVRARHTKRPDLAKKSAEEAPSTHKARRRAPTAEPRARARLDTTR